MKRKLSAVAAISCEMAIELRCRCRCGGKFHGAKRLPAKVGETDPHAPAFFCPTCGHALSGAERQKLLDRALLQASRRPLRDNHRNAAC